MTGEGEHTPEDPGREGYSIFKDALEKNNYKTEKISLIEKPEVPATCNVVDSRRSKRDMLPPGIDAHEELRRWRWQALVDVRSGAESARSEDSAILQGSPRLGRPVGVSRSNGDIILDLGAASRIFGPTSPVVGSYESHPITAGNGRQRHGVPAGSQSHRQERPRRNCSPPPPESYALINPKMPLCARKMLEKGAKGPFVIGAAASIGSGDGRPAAWLSWAPMHAQFLKLSFFVSDYHK